MWLKKKGLKRKTNSNSNGKNKLNHAKMRAFCRGTRLIVIPANDTTLTMEVVEFEHQVSLLEGSNDLPKYKTCDNCIFD